MIFSICFAVEQIEAFGGIGIMIDRFQKPRIAKYLVIKSVIPNSPAWNAGIRIADQILEIDEKDAKDMTIEQASSLMRGEIGAKVKLKLLTYHGIGEVELTRDKIDVSMKYPQWWHFCGHVKTENEICYIHPGQYHMKASDWVKIMGPYGVNYYGSQIAQDRYKFERHLRLCQETDNKAMCYLEIEKMQNLNSIAKHQMQMQAAHNLQQNVNNFNTNMQLQNINNNLQNINTNLMFMRY